MKPFRQCWQVQTRGISTPTSTNWLQHPLERASFRSMGAASFLSVGTAAAHARALHGGLRILVRDSTIEPLQRAFREH